MTTVNALQRALAAEHVAVYGYGVVGAILRGHDSKTAREDWYAHRAGRDRLEYLLREHGATPTPAATAYHLPGRVTDAKGAARLAARLEEGVTAAYAGLVANAGPRLRRYAATAMQRSARRAAYWRSGSVAFPGLPESATRPARSR